MAEHDEPYNTVTAMAAMIEAIREAGDDEEAATDAGVQAFEDRMRALLRLMLPRKIADALCDQDAHDVSWLADQTKVYLESPEDSRAEIEAFFEDGPDGTGPEMIRKAIVTTEAAQAANDPTPEELAEFFRAKAPPAPGKPGKGARRK